MSHPGCTTPTAVPASVWDDTNTRCTFFSISSKIVVTHSGVIKYMNRKSQLFPRTGAIATHNIYDVSRQFGRQIVGIILIIMPMLNTHISELDTKLYTCIQCGYLLASKQPTYLGTTKLGQTQQYTLLIAITLAMSSAP